MQVTGRIEYLAFAAEKKCKRGALIGVDWQVPFHHPGPGGRKRREKAA